VAGLSVIFILLFYLLRQALQPVRPYAVPVAGVAVLLLAGNVAGLVRLPLPQRELRLMRAAPGVHGPVGAFLLGLGFATGWTPCIGVTLGAVLTAGAVSGATLTGFLQIVAAAWAAEPTRVVNAQAALAVAGTFRPYVLADEMAHIMVDHNLQSSPITTSDGRLLGLLLQKDVVEVETKSA
jgi:Cytochrome C biogenesis protein transmembrane region